jgi:hypothetical protein
MEGMFSFEYCPNMWFPMRWNFWEMPQTYGIMTMAWYDLSEEGRLLLPCLTLESMIMFFVLNFSVEILPTYDFDSVGQTMYYSSFRMMGWQDLKCMAWFRVHFHI